MTDLSDIVPDSPAPPEAAAWEWSPPPPAAIRDLGVNATFAWDEFFGATLRNPHTRKAYARVIRSFFAWLDARRIGLRQVAPGMVGGFLDQLPVSPPSRKLALAALRRFFDTLVLRHVVILSPAASVKGERWEVLEGRTPEITPEHARQLLAAIDSESPVALRDKAILGVLIYTAARAGAVAKLRLKDFAFDGTQYTLRFAEKGGKQREIPARHDLEQYIRSFLKVVGADLSPHLPLFRSAIKRTGVFTERPMTGTDIWRMVKRRARQAGIPTTICCHSFRVATVTDLLSQGIPLGDVQYLAGHADPRTTRLYDRRPKKVTRNLVERISI